VDDGFRFVSGNLALDYAGTRQLRRSDRTDLLTGPDALGWWAVGAGLVDTPVAVDAGAFAEAVELREAIYRLAVASKEDTERRAEDVDRVNRAAARPPVSVALGRDGRVRRVGDLDAVLAELARSAIGLLGGPLASTISECGAEECTRLYVDGSRGRTRRWCDMRLCGNRAKAAGFRARHVPGPGDAPAGGGAVSVPGAAGD
jgi:predicted RNA-binding Zn ribbon-like protein